MLFAHWVTVSAISLVIRVSTVHLHCCFICPVVLFVEQIKLIHNSVISVRYSKCQSLIITQVEVPSQNRVINSHSSFSSSGAESRPVTRSFCGGVRTRRRRGVGCGEGVSPSPPGEGSGEGTVPPPQKIFEIMTSKWRVLVHFKVPF